MPSLALASTDGASVDLSTVEGTTVLYLYPMTGRPGVEQPAGWDFIPGARGCTAEACDFRDHFAELRSAGASSVFGLSVQTTAYQREAVERLHLPFAMLSDSELSLAAPLHLPTFEAGGMRLYARLTLIVSDGIIVKAFYPVFPPHEHADEIINWLTSRQE